MLRKSFQVSKPIARARIYASGLAYNHLTLNGKPTSVSLLDPTSPTTARRCFYTTHDVTALLRKGENVIGSELGSGHFDDATRTWDWGWEKAQWRGTPRLLLDLYISFADGTEQVVSSDDIRGSLVVLAQPATTAITLARLTTRGVKTRMGSARVREWVVVWRSRRERARWSVACRSKRAHLKLLTCVSQANV